MQKSSRGQYVRWMRIAIVAAVWVVFATTFARQWKGDSQVWTRVFGVPHMAGSFADLSQIVAAVESARHGLDPYLTNPYDMEHRTFIYPRVWLYAFSTLRITSYRVVGAGVALACCFLMTVSWLVLRQPDVWASMFIGVAACSSAAAFAIERGNTDLLVFCLVVIAVELECRGGLWFLLTASVLKMYPFFALLAEAVMGRRTRLLLVALVLGAAGIVVQHRDVSRQDQSLPHGYGLKEIDVAMGRAPGPFRSAFEAHPVAFRVLWGSSLGSLFISGAASGVIWGRRKLIADALRSGADPATLLGLGTYAFVLSGSIFVGTFLISTNYDYRLIFLIPLVPFLMTQARTASHRLPRLLAAAALGLIVIGLYRGIAGNIPLPALALFVKATSHAALWALLWIAGFFLGLITIVQHTAGAGTAGPGARNPLRVGLIKEST
jgi:hypothetical protein